MERKVMIDALISQIKEDIPRLQEEVKEAEESGDVFFGFITNGALMGATKMLEECENDSISDEMLEGAYQALIVDIPQENAS